MIAFQGVLSDGVTPFAGAISVSDSMGAHTLRDLIEQVQAAIDNARWLCLGCFSQHPRQFRADTRQHRRSRCRRYLGGTNSVFSAPKRREIPRPVFRISLTLPLIPNSFNVTNSVGDLNDRQSPRAITSKDKTWGDSMGTRWQAITGSTFDTGNFQIEVSDVLPPNRRKMDGTLVFTDLQGAILSRTASLKLAGNVILNGTFVNSDFTTAESGILFEANDVFTFEGTNADGSTFQNVFTISNSVNTDTDLGDGQFATIEGLIRELNYRDRSQGVQGPDGQSAFEDAVLTLTGAGTLQLIDDTANYSESSFFMKVEDNNTTRTLSDRSQIAIDGNPEVATIVVDGGERIRVEAGETVTLYGTEPTKLGESTPQLTMRFGGGSRTSLEDSIFTQGSDTLEVKAQEFVGSLNGGPLVTFQNGDQNVFFESGEVEGVAETILLNFDSVIDITGPPTDGSANTGRAILLSTINNSLNFQIGPFKGQDLRINIPDLSGDNLGYGRGSGKTVSVINVTTISGVNQALEIVDKALDQVSRTRSTLGAFTNRMETTISSLSVSSENLSASESRISDVDIASEVSAFTSNQILFQAGTSVLAQANFLPQGLLSLLG